MVGFPHQYEPERARQHTSPARMRLDVAIVRAIQARGWLERRKRA